MSTVLARIRTLALSFVVKNANHRTSEELNVSMTGGERSRRQEGETRVCFVIVAGDVMAAGPRLTAVLQPR